MRIAVFGSGGVGGYFGARLAQAGEEVVFIARGAHLDAIRKHGLRVESYLGDFTVAARAEQDPAAVGAVDVVLVAVKAWQLDEAASAMPPLVGSQTLIVPLLNGVEAAPRLAEVFDPPGAPVPHVIGGLCRISALLAAPGVVRHAAIEPSIAFNRLDGQADARVERLRQAFDRAGVKVDVAADIHAALWTKFAFIAPFSGLGALTRADAHTLRSLPETRRLLQAGIEEVVAVGRAHGVQLADDLPQRILRGIDAMDGATVASMARDIIEGRPSELEAQNGAVVRLGQAAGVETPVNAFVYACLLPYELRARAAGGR
ncbi:MAG: 2-dehydropantoate 2-reductase [Anaerolineae bacterium]|nr:2-dehydropantoate 2-reductase [Anaerolineae bacterium]